MLNKHLLAEADVEYATRIEAERVSLAWRSTIPAPCPQESIDSLPLFGGEPQQELFPCSL